MNHNQGPYGGYGPPPPHQQQHGYPPQQHYQYPPQPPTVVYVQPTMMKVPFNHTPHIIIDVLSCGAWIPFHLIIWACH